MQKTTLLIMAAGLGSRYGGNKQVDVIGPHGEMLMQYSIYDAMLAGFNKFVFVIKPEHQSVIEKFCANVKGAEIEFVYQDFSSLPKSYSIPSARVKPFGTVHAVLCAKDIIHEPFAVINADDFYGRDAFFAIHEKLLTLKDGDAAMVAYRLQNTVSPSGAVTRGICETEDGLLRAVRETYKITLEKDGSIRDESCGILNPNALVSMNMWGFTPEIFKNMGELLESFLASLSPEDIKSELALPTMVDGMIGKGELKVHVLSTSAVLLATLILLLFPDLTVNLDAYMGVVVAILILVAGFRILNDTKNSILGEAPSKEIVERITSLVEEYPAVLGIHDLVVHNYGPGHVIAALHVEVDGRVDIFESHDMVDLIEQRLRRECKIEATIHMDPIVTDDEETNRLRALVTEEVRKIHEELRIHDFRFVRGVTHSNMIFDVAAPFELALSDEELCACIADRVSKIDASYFTVVTVDRE